jgi:hypothetical protein
VEESPGLMAVQWVFRRIHVQHDALRQRLVRVEEDIDEEILHRLTVHGDLLVTTVGIGPDRSEFQAVERALAGQGLALVPLPRAIFTQRILLAHQHRQQRIVTQGVMIVEVFVTQAQSVHPLGNQIRNAVLDEIRIAMVGETAGELPQNARDPLGLTQKQRPGI